MKAFIVAFALIAAVAGDVSHLAGQRKSYGGADVDAQVLRQDSDVAPDSYNYVYETSNGISAQASGQLKNAGREEAALVSQGSFQYTAPDGTPIQISYTADEFGFQPQGNHLPTPPPTQAIPEAILRSLEYIRTHPQPEQQQPRRF